MPDKRWTVAEPISNEVKNKFPEIKPVVLQLLLNRGITTQEEIDIFLGPDWSRDVHDPFLFSKMRDAVDRVFAALENSEVITVHGDYDADGVCGSAVLISTLREIAEALKFDPNKINGYIPHREKEGYGMSVPTVEHLKDHEKTSLIITVDCGISNKDAIDRGKEIGIDTIVCDHHTMPEIIPDQAILIHPLVPGETYPNKKLCGTAVAYKLASALIIEARNKGADFPKGYEKWLLDLVAIATVTDVMPLKGENRVLEKYGLLVLNKTKRVGLRKLIDVAGGKWGELDTISIGFVIGPRINAAGRMNHANEALHLILEKDEYKATELAEKLNQTNIERRSASDAMYKEALEQIGELGDRKLIVAVKDGWPAGLIGLVAGKLLSKFNRPVFVIGKVGDKYVGSGRSIDGFDITAALRKAGDFMDRFGGHPQACGFSTSGKDRFDEAVRIMTEYTKSNLTDEALAPELKIDSSISLDDIDWDLYEDLQAFKPFGKGNRPPLFSSSDLEVIYADPVGKDGSHLRLTVKSERGKMWKMIGFRFGHMTETVTGGSRVNVAYEIEENVWKGRREIQLRIVDLQTV